MSELVLRSATERLQSLMLAEGTSPLNPSASTDLNAIVKQLNQMLVLLKEITQHKVKVRQIDELSYHIKDVIESPNRWGRNWLRNVELAFSLRKLKSILKQIEVDPVIPIATSPVRDELINIIGLDEDRRQVCKYLLPNEHASSSSLSSSSPIGVPVIPICGGVGSGKTTLAKLVFRDVSNKFKMPLWVDVSDKFEIGRILKQIIDSGHEWISCYSKEDQLEQIKKVLKSQRTLIVLDDIRSTEAWETLCRILPKLVQGSYVVVTTRVVHVAEYISPKQFVHNMKPLNEGDSLALFNEVFPSAAATTSSTETESGTETPFFTSDTDTDNNTDGKMIADMVRCCNGSPQLIKDLALCLKSKTREEWKIVLNKIQAHLSEFRCGVYNELPVDLQPCFIYLGHFLENQEIDPEKLSHLWMIESLLSTGKSPRGERMIDMTQRYLRELALKGMVEVQAEEVQATTKRLKACRLTQGMEDFCVSNCEHKCFLKIIDLRREDCSHSLSEGPQRLVIYLGNRKVDISPKVAKDIRSLRVVLLRNQQQIQENEWVCPSEMLKLNEYGRLRILDFDGIDFQRKKLPRGIFNLKLLRYLSFKGCVLVELPSSISKLSYLLVLDLRVEEGLVETKIPDVLRKMRRLNHLYLPLKFATQNGEKLQLDSLTELETLVNFNTRLCRANDLLKLCKLQNLTAKVEKNFDDFESVTNFMKASSSNNWQLHCSIDIIELDCFPEERYSVLREFLQCKVLRTLHFNGYIGRLPPYDKISPNLTQLVLNNSYLKKDSMPILEKLPSLGVLILSNHAYEGKEMVFSASGFPQLKCLQLLNLSSLQRVEVDNTAIPILTRVEIKNCEQLDTKNCGKLANLMT
ncbi:unnamed protein product [Withania somnifera]